MNKRKIPSTYPQLTNEDIEILHKVVDERWYTEGKYCKKFIRELCKVFDTKHAVLTNSGSSADLVALRAVSDFFRGKYVIVSAAEFPTLVAAVYHCGLIPIYVDVDPKTLSPDIGQIEYAVDKYGEDVAGAFLSHYLGFPFNEPLVREILGYSRFLISDGCDSLGAMIGNKPVGYWSDASTCSFFPAHHVFAVEGGSIHTNDDKYIKRMTQYISWGRDCYCLPGQSNVCGKRFEYKWDKLPEGWDHKYTFTRLGYNLKSNEFSGALGFSQIQRLSTIVEKRIENTIKLLRVIRPYTNYIEFVESYDGHRPSPFGFPIIVKDDGLLNPMIQHLEGNGIATRRFFGGNLMRQPGFQDMPYIAMPDYDGANKLMEQGFWIGTHPGIDDGDIDYMYEKIKEFFDERGLY